MWQQGTVPPHPSGSTALAAQLHARDAQLAEAAQQLEASRSEIAALKEDAARKEQQLQASLAETAELTRQVGRAQTPASRVIPAKLACAASPATLLRCTRWTAVALGQSAAGRPCCMRSPPRVSWLLLSRWHRSRDAYKCPHVRGKAAPTYGQHSMPGTGPSGSL
jgi:hypothetical protein